MCVVDVAVQRPCPAMGWRGMRPFAAATGQPATAANGLRVCQATAAHSWAWKAASTGVPVTLAAQLAMLV